LPRDELSQGCGIDREIFGQCDYGNTAFESVEFITILKHHFEIVLNRSF